MSDDLVTRLRFDQGPPAETWQSLLMEEAADEILRLRGALERLAELARMHARYEIGGDELAELVLEAAAAGLGK